MDLHSGLPFWMVKNELFDLFNPLRENLKIDVAIIGSGITGALVAHELCEAGIECAVFDRRTISTGSTVASTAQLQYEIDIPLCQLKDIVGIDVASKAYRYSLQSINDLENIFEQTKIDADFKRVPTVFLASNKKGLKMIEKEYAIRKKIGLPVEFWNSDILKSEQNIEGWGALYNESSAQMDAYKAATKLLHYHQHKHGMPLYSHTQINSYSKNKNGYELVTEHGKTIYCKYVIIATGFEAGQFLPKKVMQLNSTYVIISNPVDVSQLWPKRSLIWETREPYLYMRTTADNRMIVGGEDERFQNPQKRDELLRHKIKRLEDKFKKLYPSIDFTTDMAWCGTFSSTKDGLPYVGPYSKDDKMLFALGYGGNGITFSVIAAQTLSNIIKGKKDERTDIFGFDR